MNISLADLPPALPRPDTRFVPLVSDLFDALPDGTRPDVVTFNPPAVGHDWHDGVVTFLFRLTRNQR
ncbi:hypothetical protein [Micromonospora sp. WMMD737]|uniref:hypothetical protein n=1 Tax=Micromonospora sp. WMMD737 TaxID=3404113 RepID=UPI003B952745